MATEDRPDKLTRLAAITELGWFPLAFAMFVGGPSILTIMGTLFVDQELVPTLQWIVDVYSLLMSVLGAIVEPLVQPAINWIAVQMNWRLTLDPVWRPLFALGMVLVLGLARAFWRSGTRRYAIGICVFVGFGVLVGTLVSGLAPSNGGWWAEGLRATAPIFCCWAAARSYFAALVVAKGGTERLEVAEILVVAFVGLCFFCAAAGIHLVSGLAGIGVLTLGVAVASLGVLMIVLGLSEEFEGHIGSFFVRAGFSVLGGFVVAGLILTADWGLKALNA